MYICVLIYVYEQALDALDEAERSMASLPEENKLDAMGDVKFGLRYDQPKGWSKKSVEARTRWQEPEYRKQVLRKRKARQSEDDEGIPVAPPTDKAVPLQPDPILLPRLSDLLGSDVVAWSPEGGGWAGRGSTAHEEDTSEQIHIGNFVGGRFGSVGKAREGGSGAKTSSRKGSGGGTLERMAGGVRGKGASAATPVGDGPREDRSEGMLKKSKDLRLLHADQNAWMAQRLGSAADSPAKIRGVSSCLFPSHFCLCSCLASFPLLSRLVRWCMLAYKHTFSASKCTMTHTTPKTHTQAGTIEWRLEKQARYKAAAHKRIDSQRAKAAEALEMVARGAGGAVVGGKGGDMTKKSTKIQRLKPGETLQGGGRNERKGQDGGSAEKKQSASVPRLAAVLQQLPRGVSRGQAKLAHTQKHTYTPPAASTTSASNTTLRVPPNASPASSAGIPPAVTDLTTIHSKMLDSEGSKPAKRKQRKKEE